MGGIASTTKEPLGFRIGVKSLHCILYLGIPIT